MSNLGSVGLSSSAEKAGLAAVGDSTEARA